MKGHVEVNMDLLEIQAEMLSIDMELYRQDAIETAISHGWDGRNTIDLMDLIIDHEEVRDVWIKYKSALSYYDEFMVKYNTLGV